MYFCQFYFGYVISMECGKTPMTSSLINTKPFCFILEGTVPLTIRFQTKNVVPKKKSRAIVNCVFRQ